MKIYFDNTLINNNYIMSLSQEGQLFDSNFRLGSTLCRVINMDVAKEGVSSHPSIVYIKNDSNVTLFTMLVDNVDDTNDAYYSYTLVDKMVLLNNVYDWSSLQTKTVQNIVNAICTNVLGTSGPTVTYLNDLVVTWDDTITARDFISYVAEVNGCFAKIDATGNLLLVPFSNYNPVDVDINTCADFKLGEYHQIDRVVVDLGANTKKCPDDEHYTGTHNTLYVNSNNILLTDSGSYTIQGTIDHIYSLVNGFEFYSLETSRCEIDDSVETGDCINLTDGTNDYLSIAQINWTYNNQWLGGYSLDVETKQQEETQINAASKFTKSIKIIVDRELGVISQRVTNVEGAVSVLQQTASDLTIAVTRNTEDLTAVRTKVVVSADDVTITQNDADNYTKFSDNGMDIYVDNEKVAWAESDGFHTPELSVGEWFMKTTNGNNTCNFVRRSES